MLSRAQVEVSPLENAISVVENKNHELRTLVSQYQHQQHHQQYQQLHANINLLSMTLNGVIDAAVNGGIARYQEVPFHNATLMKGTADPDPNPNSDPDPKPDPNPNPEAASPVSQAFFQKDYISSHPEDTQKITQLKELMQEQVRSIHAAPSPHLCSGRASGIQQDSASFRFTCSVWAWLYTRSLCTQRCVPSTRS